MTRLVFVRHGESIWHGDNRYAGSSDVRLSETGTRQAAELAGWAVNAGLTAVWSSPMTRTLETAGPVAALANLPVHSDERLRELAFGDGEGKTIAEMRQLFPQEVAAFLERPATHHLPGGEPPGDGVARAMAAIDEITADKSDGRVMVVMHSTLLRLVLCHLLGLPLDSYRRVFPNVGNARITEVRLNDGVESLLQFNSPAGVDTHEAQPAAGPVLRRRPGSAPDMTPSGGA